MKFGERERGDESSSWVCLLNFVITAYYLYIQPFGMKKKKTELFQKDRKAFSRNWQMQCQKGSFSAATEAMNHDLMTQVFGG